MLQPMPITLDQIVEETRHWPREQVAELVDTLTLALHLTIAPEIEAAWEQETRRRVAEMEGGQVQEVPGEEVSAHIRQIVSR
jgi:hypothetical protein